MKKLFIFLLIACPFTVFSQNRISSIVPIIDGSPTHESTGIKPKSSYSVDSGAFPSSASSVTATAVDDVATVKIDQATDIACTLEERTATITVTAADGITQKVYTAVFYQTPTNGKDAYLNVISLSGGGKLSPDFTITNFNYTVYMPEGSEIPIVNGLTSDMSATKDVTQATNLSGSEKDRTATIVVTSKDKSVTNTYTMVFSTQTVTLSKGYWMAKLLYRLLSVFRVRTIP